MTKDPAAVLAEARAALAKARAISYTATAGDWKGTIVAARAEAGGWRLAVNGKGTGVEHEIGFDGVNARSIHAKDKVLVEKTVMDWPELVEFIAAEGAGPGVAWELLGESPLEMTGKLTYDGQETIDETVCDLVHAEQTDGAGLRVALGVDDHLPRRIVRLGTGAMVLEMREVKLDADAVGGVYALGVPDGYRIRAPESAARVRTPGAKPGQILGDPEGKAAQARGTLAVGVVAPEWDLKNAAGESVKLADFRGKVVVLDFWGTWCGWCVKAMPQLQKVHDAYKDKPVAVLGMNTENDPDADPAGFMRRNKYTYGLLLNAEKPTKEYKVSGFPTLFVVGKDGKIVAVEEGFSPDLFEKLSKTIDAALGAP